MTRRTHESLFKNANVLVKQSNGSSKNKCFDRSAVKLLACIKTGIQILFSSLLKDRFIQLVTVKLKVIGNIDCEFSTFELSPRTI